MNSKSVFTICAKNYLAQALALKSSVERYNKDVDFYLFLSDDKDGQELPEVIELSDEWMPEWRKMAFKYDVVEFATAVKPYAFARLFGMGYDKAVYLDPDICTFAPLDYIFESLDEKSVVLTPHRCSMETEERGAVSEPIVQTCGIYNLGFCGLRRDEVGLRIVAWWQERLKKHCYRDVAFGMNTDQIWMNFIPGYFPTQTLISHHVGLNLAHWNMHERSLVDDGHEYAVVNNQTQERYPLVFFHFSGYSQLHPNLFCKGSASSSLDNYPDYRRLFGEYHKSVMQNGFEKYSRMSYKYNTFDNGTPIPHLCRRIYRVCYDELSVQSNPFDNTGDVYRRMMKSKFLTKAASVSPAPQPSGQKAANRAVLMGRLHKALRFVFKCIGLKRYLRLMVLCAYVGREENSACLLKK